MTKKKTVRKEQEKQPMKYWLVEITLTSGEGLQFYVSAKNQFEANIKADSYRELAQNKELLKCYQGKGFTLLP
jgi:hypothetical protein